MVKRDPTTGDFYSEEDTDISENLTLLGQSGVPAQKKLERFSTPDYVEEVSLHVAEFTSVCPVTGQPDFASIDITYRPLNWCIESKSLKLYLQTFREEGHFAEALAGLIAQELFKVLEPRWVVVTVNQSSRGGITIHPTAVIGDKEH